MPIRRIIITLLVFLVLGATVNVAVAWGIVLTPNDPSSFPLAGYDRRYNSFQVVNSDRNLNGSHSIDIYRGEIRVRYSPGLSGFSLSPLIDDDYYRQLLPSWSRFRDTADIVKEFRKQKLFGFTSYEEHASGWPIYALRSRSIHCFDLENSRDFPAESLGAPLRLGSKPNQRLPLRPIWPGFLINTLLYGTALWMLCMGPFALRRAIRRRHGKCAHCGYPVGASPVCTECGRAVRASSVEITVK